jgi:hypothetical protein
MPDLVPLHLLIAAVRSHQPTSTVVPEWLYWESSTEVSEEHWYDSRHMDNPCPVIADDAARLIFEACMWDYCAKNRVQVVWVENQWCKPVMRAFFPLGTDLSAALAFACGVPLPDKETK